MSQAKKSSSLLQGLTLHSCADDLAISLEFRGTPSILEVCNRRVPPCAVKTCVVRPVFARVVGELWTADPNNVQGPVKQNASPGEQSEAPRRRWKPGQGQHPGPENQDSQDMPKQPRGYFPDLNKDSYRVARFGSVTVWGWNDSSGSGFGSAGSFGRRGFWWNQHSSTETDCSGSGFGSWNTETVLVPLSASRKTVLTVPVSGSGSVPEPP